MVGKTLLGVTTSFWGEEANETFRMEPLPNGTTGRGPGLHRESSHNLGLFEMAPLRARREDIVPKQSILVTDLLLERRRRNVGPLPTPGTYRTPQEQRLRLEPLSQDTTVLTQRD